MAVWPFDLTKVFWLTENRPPCGHFCSSWRAQRWISTLFVKGPEFGRSKRCFFFHIESKVNLRRKLRNDWLEKWTIWVEVCPILKMGKNISARGCNCLINNKIYMQDLHTIPRFPADSFKMTALQVGWKKSAFLKPFAPPWESRNIIDSKDIKSAGVAVRQKTLRKRKEFPFHPSKTGWLWEEVFSESIAPTKF